jgi:hypothetical protein
MLDGVIGLIPKLYSISSVVFIDTVFGKVADAVEEPAFVLSDNRYTLYVFGCSIKTKLKVLSCA